MKKPLFFILCLSFLSQLASAATDIESIRRRADNGDTDAALQAGKIYARGNVDVEANLEEAVKYLEIAANAGSKLPDANFLLGTIYLKGGDNVTADENEAVKNFAAAAMLGEVRAVNELAKLKKSGYAICELGICYSNGYAVEKNPAKAVEFWKKSAEIGDDPRAFGLLGCAYETGDGVEVDLKKAAEFYLNGAKASDYYSCERLADFYKNGLGGLKKDRCESEKWEKAARQLKRKAK